MDSLKHKMWEFHKRNPHVMDLVEKYTFEAIRKGRKHYSINSIFERIRWHEDIETGHEDFKLSNNHRAYYARYFHHKHPKYDGFFKIKQTKGE